MNVADPTYLEAYTNSIGKELPVLIRHFDFSDDNGSLDYLTKASAVYSSNIEGNSVDLNSYMNYELSKEKFKPGKEIDEIENLVAAYKFAQENPLTEENFLHCHKIFSKTLLIRQKRGKYRTEPVGIYSRSGLVYLAIEPEFVGSKMEVFFEGVDELLEEELSVVEVFYFASFIHLRFAHIHPFMDGNGRAARLLEKWFLASKLGQRFWKIPSEEYYKNHQADYYENINLGVNFYELDYGRCLPFLEMLPNSLK